MLHLSGTLRHLRLLCLVLLLAGLAYPRNREAPAGTFFIDVDHPYDRVVDAMRDVVNNGVILGTFEYKDTQELPDAESAHPCPFFKPWKGNGEVFCKVRRKALSPAHFIGSNDMGTVAVRYVVQPLAANSTRLFIDAIFVEDARRQEHASDGFVETSEFGYLQEHLKELARPPAPVTAQGRPAPQGEEVEPSKTGDLQQAITDQRAALDAANAALSQLEVRAQQLRTTTMARIGVDRAEMKAFPYVHAQAVQVLGRGDDVTILVKSPYWFRVRSADGQEGWLHHSDLESQP
jgi:hypothetical protein